MFKIKVLRKKRRRKQFQFLLDNSVPGYFDQLYRERRVIVDYESINDHVYPQSYENGQKSRSKF